MRISDWSSDVCSSDLDSDRLSGIAVLDRRFVGPERRGGAGFPDVILFVLLLEQHRPAAVGAADDRGQLLREVTEPTRMKPLIVDQDLKSTRLDSSHQCAARISSSH